MNLVNEILKLFSSKENVDEIKIEDKFSSFEIEYPIENIQKLKTESLISFLHFIPIRDDFILSITFGENEPNVLSDRNDDLSDFTKEINSRIDYLEDEKVYIRLNCSKNTKDGLIHIYHYLSFCSHWSKSEPKDLLLSINKLIVVKNSISFIFLEEGLDPFNSINLKWGYTRIDDKLIDYKALKANEECHFGNYEEYPFNPNCFHLINPPKVENEITSRLNQFDTLFSITSIFDITSIKNNNLLYKLNGYRSFEGLLPIDEIDENSSKVYNELYNWIYSTDGNISDKVGLSRNILTIFLKKNTINLPDEIIPSIKSGYKTYLQQNITKYIDLRNKINDELSWVSQKSSEVVANFFGNYQKSIFTFLSFFISVFVIQIIKTSEFTNVFTKEATILSFSFLAISIVFLIFSLFVLNDEKKRISRKYDNIKNRYKDLLIEEDINNILRNDTEFLYEMSFITKRRKSYTLLWILTLLVLSITILFLSSYININSLIHLFITKC